MEPSVDFFIREMKRMAEPNLIEQRKKKFGIEAKNALGLSQKQLNELIKGVSKNKELALALYESEIYEGRLLCGKLYPEKELTKDIMEAFVTGFENWEICDTYCLKLFCKSDLVIPKIYEWSERDAEFEKRAAFATIAALCMADKKSSNEIFTPFFELILKAAEDERIYVKKAVNWALRGLGKRNIELKAKAIEISKQLLERKSKTSQWIAKDALKELQHPKVRIADYPRSIYRLKSK